MIVGVTGADGQLGCSLRKIAVDFPQHAFVFSGRREVDITDRAAVEAWLESGGVEAVVNCAAYTAVDRAETEPDEAWRVNALGPGILGEICAERSVGLIHLSTDYVFGGTGETPLRESDPAHPLSVYGSTKRQGEQAVRESGCDALVVRTSWLYSEFGNNFVRTMLRLGRLKERLEVVDDRIGSPTYAVNLARAVVQLIDRGFSGFEVYHYCDEGLTTWYDFARMIFIMTGNPVTVVPVDSADYPTAAQRPAYSALDTSKIRRAGVRTPYWVDALRECLTVLANENT